MAEIPFDDTVGGAMTSFLTFFLTEAGPLVACSVPLVINTFWTSAPFRKGCETADDGVVFDGGGRELGLGGAGLLGAAGIASVTVATNAGGGCMGKESSADE